METRIAREVQGMIDDIRAAALLAESAPNPGELLRLVRDRADQLAGILGLEAPVGLDEAEMSLIELYRRLPGQAQGGLYQIALAFKSGPSSQALDNTEADVLAFFRQLADDGQRMAIDLMGILSGEWALPTRQD